MTLVAFFACAGGAAGQNAGEAPPQGSSSESPPAVETAPPSTTAPTAPASPASGSVAPGAAGAVATGGGDQRLPPCVPVHRARPKHHKRKERPASETAAIGPPRPAPGDAVVDAEVGDVGTSLGPILGRDVTSPKGEDLGRVVDVLADAQGHVRVAIIDFGGFLGVGTRRIAVDWPLLRFDQSARDKPLILSVDRQKLQSAPEYNPNKPRVLVPPAAPDVSDAGQPKK
jgi:hypothetical protein